MFKHEYHSIWSQEDSYRKAELLWLWYDYHTEMYDRGLIGQHPAPDDETMVLHHNQQSRRLSQMYAVRIYNLMLQVAKRLNLSGEIMQETKMNRYRRMSKMSKRIEDYLMLEEKGEFDFVYKLGSEYYEKY